MLANNKIRKTANGLNRGMESKSIKHKFLKVAMSTVDEKKWLVFVCLLFRQ